MDKAKISVDKLTPTLAALVVEEVALAKVVEDAKKEAEANSTNKKAVAAPVVVPASPDGKLQKVKEMRTLCLSIPPILSQKYFGPENGGLFNEMLARLELIVGELDVYSQSGDAGISQDEVVPLQQALEISEGFEEKEFTDFISGLGDDKTRKVFEKIDAKIGLAHLKKFTNDLGIRNCKKLKNAAAHPAMKSVDSTL